MANHGATVRSVKRRACLRRSAFLLKPGCVTKLLLLGASRPRRLTHGVTSGSFPWHSLYSSLTVNLWDPHAHSAKVKLDSVEGAPLRAMGPLLATLWSLINASLRLYRWGLVGQIPPQWEGTKMATSGLQLLLNETSWTCGWKDVAQMGQQSKTPGHTHQYTRLDPETHPHSCRCPPEFPRKQRGIENARWLCALSKSENFTSCPPFSGFSGGKCLETFGSSFYLLGR